jgi:small subunit ribosomal protein S1
MAELEIGQIRKGVVKNIADFGAFVDLGGIDGLLHITDMSWERIGHPTEMVAIDQEIEVKILQIDREKQKIALGLKQKQNNPWTNIAEKFPVGSTVPGEVVNVMSYGAFVKLEPGIEGLVHISEMSWTRRINHPSEMVQIGDKIDVRILGVDPQGQQLSLGIKQTQKSLARFAT